VLGCSIACVVRNPNLTTEAVKVAATVANASPRCCGSPARSSGALAATSTRAQCSRELRRYGDRKLAACMPPLSQPHASRCLLESFQRTSAVFGAFIRTAAALIALPSAGSRTLAPASTPCRGFRNQSRGCLRRSRPHVQAHRQRNSGRPPHLTKRIEQWSEANGYDARAETMHMLLARGSRAKKRKPQRTKTQVAALGE
jgi:hypothetical protein